MEGAHEHDNRGDHHHREVAFGDAEDERDDPEQPRRRHQRCHGVTSHDGVPRGAEANEVLSGDVSDMPQEDNEPAMAANTQ